MRINLAVLGLLSLAACAPEQPQRSDLASSAALSDERADLRAGAPVFHFNPAFKDKGYPFSEAVEAGGFVFLSGQIGTDPKTAELVGGGIEPQSRQTMENIKAALARRDLTFADVVKCTVMIDDMADWPAFNTVYAEYLTGNFLPAARLGQTGWRWVRRLKWNVSRTPRP